jgi:predicted MPP superfamily phosphohydrolase
METLNRKNFLKILGASSLAMLSSKASASSIFNAFEDKKPSSSPLRLAHLTDIHIQPGLESEKGFASCLHAVNMQKPDLILNGGDAIMNEAFTFSKEKVKKQWQLFHKMMVAENSLPIHHCIGNHDLYGWAMPSSTANENKSLAMDEYKITRPYYSTQYKKWKFIVLDSIRAKNSVPGYYAQLDDEQLFWL